MANVFGRIGRTEFVFGDPSTWELGVAAPQGAPRRAPTPRLVTRGERGPDGPKAFVDWLSITVGSEHFPNQLDWVPTLAQYLGVPGLSNDAPGRGVAGFREAASLLLDCEGESVVVGKIAWGGESQRGRVYMSLSGTLCARVKDWRLLVVALSACTARITRVDLAHDDAEGHRSVDFAVGLYDAGAFRAGGRNPACSFQGDWKQVSGSGRTFYVGRKAHGKLLRVYEKGKQLGDPNSAWVRWEVEFHNRDRHIPYDVLLDPARYLAGAFPALAFVSDTRTAIRTQRKAVQASLDHLVSCMSASYGKAVNALHHQGLTPDEIVSLVMRPGIPARLQHPMAACEPGAKLYPDGDGKP